MASEIELNSIQTSLEEGKNLLERKCVICLEMDEKSKPVVKPEELKCECHTYFHPACFNEYQLNFNKCPTCEFVFVPTVIYPFDWKVFVLCCLGLVWSLSAFVFLMISMFTYNDVNIYILVIVELVIGIFQVQLVAYMLLVNNKCCAYFNLVRCKEDLIMGMQLCGIILTVVGFFAIGKETSEKYHYIGIAGWILLIPYLILTLFNIIDGLIRITQWCGSCSIIQTFRQRYLIQN